MFFTLSTSRLHLFPLPNLSCFLSNPIIFEYFRFIIFFMICFRILFSKSTSSLSLPWEADFLIYALKQHCLSQIHLKHVLHFPAHPFFLPPLNTASWKHHRRRKNLRKIWNWIVKNILRNPHKSQTTGL